MTALLAVVLFAADPATPDPLAVYRRFPEGDREKLIAAYETARAAQLVELETRHRTGLAKIRELQVKNKLRASPGDIMMLEQDLIRVRIAHENKWARNDPPYFPFLSASSKEGDIGKILHLNIFEIQGKDRLLVQDPNSKFIVLQGLRTDYFRVRGSAESKLPFRVQGTTKVVTRLQPESEPVEVEAPVFVQIVLD